MKFNDMALGAFMTVFGGAVALHAQTFPVMAGMQFGPEFFPTLIGGGMAICGLGLMAKWAVAGRPGPWVARPDWMGSRINILRALGVLLAVVFYILAVPHLGFLLTMALTSFGLLTLLGNRLWLAALIAVLLPVILHFGFSVGLRVPLPRGPIETWLF